MPAKRKAKPQKVKKGSVLGWCIKWLFVLGIWGGIIGGSVLAWYGAELPRITKAADFERRNTIIVKDRHGEVIGRYGDLRGQVVSIADLPAYLPQAVIAIEDRHFYQHKGVDPLGIARADREYRWRWCGKADQRLRSSWRSCFLAISAL